MIYVLDAHVFLWMLEDNPKLSPRARELLSEPEVGFVLPAIALAEVCRVVTKKKSSLPDVQAVIRAISSDDRFSVASCSRSTVEQVFQPIRVREGAFPDYNWVDRTIDELIPELHDQLIVATTLDLMEVEDDVLLVTNDATILRSGLCPVLW